MNFFKKYTISQSAMTWIAGVCAIAVGLEIAVYYGVLQQIYEKDLTKLSVVIGCIFLWQTAKCGYELICQSRNKRTLEQGDRSVEKGWLWSDIVLSLGMIGTVIGFMLMLSGFSSVNFEDVSSVQSLIATLSSGMSTSLSTTLVGLVASVILKLQFFGLEKSLEDRRNKGKIL